MRFLIVTTVELESGPKLEDVAFIKRQAVALLNGRSFSTTDARNNEESTYSVKAVVGA